MKVFVVIPLGEAATIELRPFAPEGLIGPPLPFECAYFQVDSFELTQRPAEDLAIHYCAPAIAALQRKLIERAFGEDQSPVSESAPDAGPVPKKRGRPRKQQPTL